MTSLKLILGSGSPRRRQLLTDMGLQFDIRVSDADESAPATLSPAETVEWVAKSKANALRNSLAEGELLLTADTEVWQDNHRFGKPKNARAAREMLEKLSGKSHQVISGFCLADKDHIRTYHVITNLRFKELSEDEISFYINTFEPFDKAGAYGIQEWIGMIGIEQMEGSYYNVVGLPTKEVWEALRAWPNEA
ncbi:Maf family nucleotide pyrophosphatase [Phaeocystidibacter luteus]|uniref:dTTP/UTP pyrophosphatase n=1 Tax=Phaeocystidibacter luteus TaxID=911197 RepID=A0A6N6RCS8_9FLAO|nr:Maf family nucleotide pyrophosphatase [Phaeocystidibacter luteus]KAB2805447.1 septum formation protein Maf [Phaeocystidibacter luteus]